MIEYIEKGMARGFIREKRIESTFMVKVKDARQCELLINHFDKNIVIPFRDQAELDSFIDNLKNASQTAFTDNF